MESLLGVLYTGNWPARVWGLLPGTSRVTEVRHSVTLSHPEIPRCRIAFASDLHIGPTTAESLLRQAFRVVRDAAPDVLLLGGDYVFLDITDQGLRLLTELVASVPCAVKLAVLGNHDLWTDEGRIAGALESAGATVLVNQSVSLPPPWQHLTVVGLDDPLTGHCDAEAAFGTVPEGASRVVLCHAPDGLLHLRSRRFDLFLCGHTHGGQIATPWGPLVVPKGVLCRQFHAGASRMNGGTVMVSRGLGGVEVPMRWFAPPDTIIVDCQGFSPSEQQD